ncbi:hypothetical protein HaLaN_26691, partial [Haematococcus lacustris]
MRGMTFCFAAVLVSIRRGVSLDLSRIANALEWQWAMGWMDDVDSDDDLEIVNALGFFRCCWQPSCLLRLPRMGCFYKYSMKPFWGHEEFGRATTGARCIALGTGLC